MLLFLLLALAVYLPTANYSQDQNFDVVAVAVPVWSIVERGTVDVRPHQDRSPWFYEVDGRYVSNRWPGTMIVGAPAYLLASHWVPDDVPSLWPASLTAVVTSALAVTTLFALTLAMHGRRVAWTAGIAIAFSTGMWTVAADSLWTHGPAVLAIGLALATLRTGRQWLAGSCFGFMGLVRPHLLAAAAIVGYVLAREQRDFRALVRLAVPSVIGLLLYGVYAGQLSGQGGIAIVPYAFVPPEGWDRLANVGGMLIAPRVGLIIYTPVLACCVLRLGQAWRDAETWERAAFFGGAVYLVVQLQTNYFFGGYSFYGYRLPLEGLAFMVPLLVRGGALFAAASGTRVRVIAGLLALSVWTSTLGALFHHGRRDVLSPPWTTYGPAEALAGREPVVIFGALVIGVAFVLGAVMLVRPTR